MRPLLTYRPFRHTYQYAFFEAFSRTPMEHTRGVVLHFSLFEIKVFRLIVGNTDLNAVVVHVSAGRPASSCRPLDHMKMIKIAILV